MSKKWVLSIFITLFSVVALSQAMLQSGFFSKKIERFAQARLEEIMGRAVSFEGVGLNLFSSSMTIQGLSLPSNAPDHPPLFFAKRLQVYVSPGSVFTKAFLVRSVEIDAPVVHLTAAEIKKLSSPQKARAQKVADFGAVPPVVVREVSVRDGRLVYQGDGQLRAALLSALSFEVKPDLAMRQFDVRFDAKKGLIATQALRREIDAFEGEAVIQSDQLQVKKGFVSSGKATLLTDGFIRFNTEKPLDFQVDLHLPIEEIPRSGLNPALQDILKSQPVSGDLSFTGSLTGAMSDVSLRGKLAVPKLNMRGESLASIRGDLSYESRRIVFSGFSGDLFSGTFSGDLEAELPGVNEAESELKKKAAFKAQVTYKSLPVARLASFSPFAPQLGGDALKGVFASGDVAFSHLGKAAEAMKAAGAVRAVRLPLFSPPADAEASPTQKALALLQNGRLNWTWSSEGLTLKSGELDLPETTVSFQGTWSKQLGLSLDMELSSQDVQPISQVLHVPLTGALHANGRLTHREGVPVFKGGFLLESGTLRGQSFTSLVSEVGLKGRQIEITKAVMTVPAKKEAGTHLLPVGLYAAKGRLNLADLHAPRFDFKVDIQSGNPQEVFHFLHLKIPLYATVNGSVTVLGVPKSFQVKGPLTLGEGVLYGETFEQGRVDLTVSEKSVRLENAVLSKGKSLLSGKGEIHYDQTYSLALKGERLRVQQTHLLDWMPPEVKARVGLVVAGEGSFKKPQIRFVAAVKDFQYRGFSAERGTIRADWHDQEISFDGHFPEHRVSLEGDVKIAPFFPISFTGSFQQFRVDPLINPSLSTPITEMKVQASGELSGSGEIFRPAKVSLSGSLSEMHADFGAYRLHNDGPLAVQARDGVFTFQNTRLKGENTSLAINGSLTLLKRWDLFVKGEADLNLITFFSKKIATAKGKAVLDLAVSDDWAAPKLRGELSLKEGRIRAVRFSQPLEIESISAMFNEREVILDHLQGNLGGGDFYAAGKASLSGFRAGDFGFLLELKRVRLDLTDGLPATTDGELFFQRKGLEQTLKGDLRFKNVSYEKNLDLKKFVTDLIKKRGNQLSEETPIIGQTRINLHVYGSEGIWVANNLAKMPLVVDLVVKGSFDHPQLLGRVDIADGEIYFRKNTFKVASGSVNFLSLDEINPHFELNARTDVRNIVTDRSYAIDLTMSGTLSQITLSWNAFPALPEADILALLAIGKTSADLAKEGDGAGGEATEFVVTEFFSDPVDQVTEMVGAPVEQITGIDQIRVEPSLGGTDANSTVGTRLTAEKKLMKDRLVVIYQTTLDPSEEEVIRMVYEVNKNISLVGKREEDGQIGGDIRFRFEFR
ncbi:MAG: translocation/assembly module TamB domain-containing protein [Nitrospiria bacterium]